MKTLKYIAAAAVLGAACGDDPRRSNDWRSDGDPRTSGRGAYDSNSSYAPIRPGDEGRVDPRAPPTNPGDSQKVGPDSYGVRTPSGSAGEGRGWGGSGFGSYPGTRVQAAERGLDGGPGAHLE